MANLLTDNIGSVAKYQSENAINKKIKPLTATEKETIEVPQDKLELSNNAKNLQETQRIENESGNLLAELKSAQKDKSQSEISPGRKKYVTLEGNKLTEIIINENSNPPQARRSIYNFDANGKLLSKEFCHYKGENPKLVSNIEITINPDGTNKRKTKPAGAETTWQDIILPKIQTPAETQNSEPQKTNTNTENTANNALNYKTHSFNLYNNTYQISIPNGWDAQLEGQSGIYVCKKEDPFTGVERYFTGGTGGANPYNLILEATQTIRNKVGKDIKVLNYKENPAIQTANGPVNVSEAKIEFEYDGQTYEAIVESAVFNRYSNWSGEIDIISCKKNETSLNLPVLQTIYKSFKKTE